MVAASPVLITRRMTGHAAAAGYDRLADYVDAVQIAPPERWPLSQRICARSLRFLLRRSGSAWYSRNSLISEIDAARLWLASRNRIFHFLYGENSYRYLGLLNGTGRGRANRIVATYHTPRTRFFEVVHDRRHVERLDAAIVVSTVQQAFLADMLGPERVFFVPHGIDVEQFRPGDGAVRDTEEFRCLFVGSHMRDFDTLAQAARVLEAVPQVRISVVTKPANAEVFHGLGNVDVLGGIDDARLIELYQTSDLLVFPLLDCTANNSLLEAMACGLPVLTTDLPGVHDYVSPEAALVVPPGAARELADAVIGLAQDRDRLGRMAQAARSRALEFRWEAVAEQTRGVYRRIA